MTLLGSSRRRGIGRLLDFIYSPSIAAINRHRRRRECPGNMYVVHLEESDGGYIIYYVDLLEDDSVSITNILEVLIRHKSLILTRIVMKVMILGSEMDTLVVTVRFLDKD